MLIKKTVLILTILMFSLYASAQQIEIKGNVGIKNVNDSTPVLVKKIEKIEIHKTDSILNEIHKQILTTNDSISAKLDLIETNQHETVNWSFLLTLFISVLALWLAIKASITSRITTIISILQDKELREARKDIFVRSKKIEIKEIENPDSDYRKSVELVCQSFDSVYSMYKHTRIKRFNSVSDLIESYKRPIIICYLKSYPIIKHRRETQNHKDLWLGFEQLFNKVSKGKLKEDIANIIRDNGADISFDKLEDIEALKSKINNQSTEEELYKTVLDNIDTILFK